MQIRASQEGGMFVSPDFLTLVFGFFLCFLFQSLLLLCLLPLAFWTHFSYSYLLTDRNTHIYILNMSFWNLVNKYNLGSGSPGDSLVNYKPSKQETSIQSLGQEDPLVKKMAWYLALLPGEFHGPRSLQGYRSWCHKPDRHNLASKQHHYHISCITLMRKSLRILKEFILLHFNVSNCKFLYFMNVKYPSWYICPTVRVVWELNTSQLQNTS